jgi:hypothetical protein
MKKIIFIKLLFCSLLINAQEQKNEIISKNDNGDFGSKESFLNYFEGITKVDYSFVNNEKLTGKDFKIIIRKYKKGKLEFETILIDTKTEKMPKIKNEFYFSVFSKQTRGQQKIMFTFPTMGFFNRKIFNTDKSFEDGTFDYRDLVSISVNGKKTYEFGKEIQIGLITPPNNNPQNGILGYCEVTKNEIDVKSWYNQYKISEFFLIYLVIE